MLRLTLDDGTDGEGEADKDIIVEYVDAADDAGVAIGNGDEQTAAAAAATVADDAPFAVAGVRWLYGISGPG